MACVPTGMLFTQQDSKMRSEAWHSWHSETEMEMLDAKLVHPGPSAWQSESTDCDTSSQSLESVASKTSEKKAPKKTPKEPKRWKLVWCNDRCFIPETTPFRKALSEAARDSDSSLICLKTSSRLHKWLLERKTPKKNGEEPQTPEPYVLMTDQANASRYSGIIAMQAEQDCPSLTVLMCHSPDQVEAARLWAKEKAPPQLHSVFICMDMGPPAEFVSTLLARLNDQTAPLPTNIVQVSIPKQLQLSPSGQEALEWSDEGAGLVNSPQPGAQFEWQSPCVQPCQLQLTQLFPSPCSALSSNFDCTSTGQAIAQSHATPGAALGSSAQVIHSETLESLMSMLGCASAETLADLLERAQPESYAE